MLENSCRYPLEKPSSSSLACDELRDGIMNLSRNSNKNLICTWIIGQEPSLMTFCQTDEWLSDFGILSSIRSAS